MRFFELYVSLAMVVDGPVHRESTVWPLRGRFSYAIARREIISDRRTRNKKESDVGAGIEVVLRHPQVAIKLDSGYEPITERTQGSG